MTKLRDLIHTLQELEREGYGEEDVLVTTNGQEIADPAAEVTAEYDADDGGVVIDTLPA